MSLLDKLSDEKYWLRFYEYKTSLICGGAFENELADFIEKKEYLPVCEAVKNGEPFPLPKKSVISKTHSHKKRTIYMYPYRENMVLKLLTYLMTRKYDHLFCNGLFSFRPNRSAKDAIRMLNSAEGMGNKYTYKVDVSNYFNSVDISMFLPVLKEALCDDEELYTFLSVLLQEEYVYDNGVMIKEEKGIMAGTPVSAFYANLYLRDLDEYFVSRNIPYARYSDDIIVFADSPDEAENYAEIIRSALNDKGLRVNPDKEVFSSPEKGWTFLGFEVKGKDIDIAPVTVEKLKKKMRRKSRALLRWRQRSDVSGEKAAAAFIRTFNRKLFENSANNELTWSYWFFSVINSTKRLNEIDLYAQDCIRYIISGTRTKARFNVRYSDLKNLGYKSLVHEYYAVVSPSGGLSRESPPDTPESGQWGFYEKAPPTPPKTNM